MARRTEADAAQGAHRLLRCKAHEQHRCGRARRGQISTATLIAIDTSTELNYEDLKKTSNIIKYFAGQLILADVILTREVNETSSVAGSTIVAIGMVARHADVSKELSDANLTEVRSFLRHYRKQRGEQVAA